MRIVNRPVTMETAATETIGITTMIAARRVISRIIMAVPTATTIMITTREIIITVEIFHRVMTVHHRKVHKGMVVMTDRTMTTRTDRTVIMIAGTEIIMNVIMTIMTGIFSNAPEIK